MKAQVVRLVPLLLLACAPLFIHCGGATNPTETATETGNPPAILQQKLTIVSNGTGVELVGVAGAVNPGATVSVTNRTTGEHVAATAQGDGSVSVVVAGSLLDEYEVTVSTAAGDQTLQVFSEPNGNIVGADTLTCQSLIDKVQARVSQAVMGASRTCTNDDDCTSVNWSVRCVPDCGNRYDSVSSITADQLNADIREVENAYCDDFQDRSDCLLVGVPCNMPRGADASTHPACVAGQCALVRE